jgi:hypothetical protein
VAKPKALGEHIGGMDPGKSVDKFAGKSFAVNALMRPCRVELLEIAALLKLTREFEVVKDTKDSLNDPHSLWHLEPCYQKPIRVTIAANIDVIRTVSVMLSSCND